MKAAIFATLILSGGLALAAGSSQTVKISGIQFVPAHLVIRAGDTVIWKNEDLVPHTVTDQGKFDSGTLNPDQSYRHKFKRVGHYEYVCRFHPSMKATIEVK